MQPIHQAAPNADAASDSGPAYQAGSIEAQAQQFWQTTGAFEVSEESAKPKYYSLCMLPYPSGALHMGHVRNYTIGDVISRFKRMCGFNVLQPMGFDAFGLPAENAAIKHGIAPAQWTYANIEHMRAQLKALGYAYDWRREVVTCKPEYYRFEQLMFVRLFKKGLVYRKNSVVNWDPVDQTVLANEQVVDGRGWRSGALVEKKQIPQWFFRITAYADELLDELDRLDGWPESVKTMQRNWIGRSEGLEIDFAVIGGGASVRVFTTRPDTLLGASFVSVAAEHPLAQQAAATRPEVAEFIAECAKGGTSAVDLEMAQKRGVDSGVRVAHPLSGEPLPVWVANFVLMGYGTGAVMAVPAHDQRDYEFAKRYGLPMPQVIDAAPGANARPDLQREAFVDQGVLINSGPYDGLDYQSAFEAIAHDLSAQGKAERRINYRLRDWGVSRQRYWGCPIPIIYGADGQAVPVPEGDLPVVLPEDVSFAGVSSPLKSDPAWRTTVDPRNGEPAERETDTFDTFVESSWYYARYTSPGATDVLDQRANYWLPVDQYIGGIEHAVMHLLYFRFWHKLMRDAGLVLSSEPATRLLCQGMVIAETFYRDDVDGNRRWFNPAEVDLDLDAKGSPIAATLKADGDPVAIGALEKMSKSKNNGVDPQHLIDRYGADTVRLFSMFAAPPEQSLTWSEAGVEGMARFLRRLWNAIERHVAEGPVAPAEAPLSAAAKTLKRNLHQTIAKVRDDYERRYTYNTAIAAVMEFINALMRFDEDTGSARALRQQAWTTVVLMLNPITPHIAHALWQKLGHAETLLEDQPFPQADPAALARDTLTLAVQVNGKLRDQIEVAVDAPRELIEAAALAAAGVQRHLGGATPKKLIVVPGKIVNVVV